ncbi:MAG: hypothetical protein ACRDTG_14435, partial [Pseudonocardiaceae bacterium]
RHDVDDVYGLLDDTNKLVTQIAGIQQRHGTRLEEIQQRHGTRLEEIQQRHGTRLEEIQQALDLTVGRMDRIEDNQRRQYEALNVKLDGIVTLLRGNQPTD